MGSYHPEHPNLLQRLLRKNNQVRGLEKSGQKNRYRFGKLSRWGYFWHHLLLIFASVVAVFPLIWIMSTAFKREQDVFSDGINLIPPVWTFANFTQVLTENDGIFLRWMMNSMIVAGGTTIVGVFLAATAAYALSRFRFKGRKTTMMAFLVTQMFPGIILVVPLYRLMQQMGLLNTYWGLILANSTTALPFCVFMLKGYFDTIPISLEDAARMDGLSVWGTFYRIILPLSLPGVAVTGFFSLVTAWNEFMLALTFMNQEEMFLLPVGMKKYVFDFKTQWHLMSAAAILISMPILVVFLKVQTSLLSGKMAGAVKG